MRIVIMSSAFSLCNYWSLLAKRMWELEKSNGRQRDDG